MIDNGMYVYLKVWVHKTKARIILVVLTTDNTFLMVLLFQAELPLLFPPTVAVDEKTDLNQICTV